MPHLDLGVFASTPPVAAKCATSGRAIPELYGNSSSRDCCRAVSIWESRSGTAVHFGNLCHALMTSAKSIFVLSPHMSDP